MGPTLETDSDGPTAPSTDKSVPLHRPKIDFFVIGAAKCGTTSLYWTFSRHPDIYVPPIKEPRFMSGENWKRGWEWYAANWAKQPRGTITGDFSPSYSVSLGAQARAPRMIAEHYPDAKIIYIVRDPIAAAISNWRMAVFANRKHIDFNDAVRNLPAVGQRVRYWSQISQYRTYFSDENICVVAVEDITRNQKTMSDVFRWLNVRHEGAGIPRFVTANTSAIKIGRPPKPSIPIANRIEFLKTMRDEAENILTYAGLPHSTWLLETGSQAWLSDDEIEAQKRKELRDLRERSLTQFFAMKLKLWLAATIPRWVKRQGARTIDSFAVRVLKRWMFVRIPRRLGRIFRPNETPGSKPGTKTKS